MGTNAFIYTSNKKKMFSYKLLHNYSENIYLLRFYFNLDSSSIYHSKNLVIGPFYQKYNSIVNFTISYSKIVFFFMNLYCIQNNNCNLLYYIMVYNVNYYNLMIYFSIYNLITHWIRSKSQYVQYLIFSQVYSLNVCMMSSLKS